MALFDAFVLILVEEPSCRHHAKKKTAVVECELLLRWKASFSIGAFGDFWFSSGLQAMAVARFVDPFPCKTS